MDDLTLEVRATEDQSPTYASANAVLVTTPPVGEDYWRYRVQLTEDQAIIGFPKFGTVGIGFAREEDWNSNLPYSVEAEGIYEHIAHNAGDPAITRETCIEAIRMIQAAATVDAGDPNG